VEKSENQREVVTGGASHRRHPEGISLDTYLCHETVELDLPLDHGQAPRDLTRQPAGEDRNDQGDGREDDRGPLPPSGHASPSPVGIFIAAES
jgi:hypothetical protein